MSKTGLQERLQEDFSLNARIKLYYDLRPSTESPSPLLIALHGYGANKRQMMREAMQIAPEGFALVSLQGFHQHIREPKEKGAPLRFGFGWLTNYRSEESVEIHQQALQDLISTLTEQGLADPARIFLLGFSQSCALNYRFAFTYPTLLSGVIGICGGVPGDWDTSERYRPTAAAIFHLAGSRDEFYPPDRVSEYEKQLGTKSQSVTFKSYDAAHEITQAMRGDIRQWLLQHAL